MLIFRLEIELKPPGGALINTLLPYAGENYNVVITLSNGKCAFGKPWL